MSQTVLNNSQAIGHTDLLSGILKVQVRNEDKITEQDRVYCQNQQDELYKTLDQIAGWYNISFCARFMYFFSVFSIRYFFLV